MKLVDNNFSVDSKPYIPLYVYRTEAKTWYDLGFYKHHYLTSQLNPSCKCFVFTWDEEPVCFIGLLNTPRKGTPNGMSISRIVCLPDYQGIGIAKRCIEFICSIASNCGHIMYIKTIHEKFGKYLENSINWTPTSYNGKKRAICNEESKYKNRLERPSYCFRFCGKSLEGYDELMLPISELRNRKKEMNNNIQLEIFNKNDFA